MKRLLSIVLAFSLLIVCLPMSISAAPTERTLNFAQMSNGYRILGRAVEYQTGLLMDNVASGFEFYFNGSGDVIFNANVMCINWGNELAQYFTVVVDGVRSRARVEVTEHAKYEIKNVVLAEDLASGDHHIEVYRQTEASQSFCVGLSVTFTGTLLAPPSKAPLTFDVIGDSISGGYGCLWDGTSHQGFHPLYQDGTQTYAFLTGKTFGADVRVCQVSGYGCVRGQNTNGDNMQKLYPYLCYNRDETPYSFDTLADVVIINLGTNDSRVGVTAAEFQVGSKALMQLAREKNPGAKIVWCTGMMGTFYKDAVQASVNELGGAANGYYFVTLPYNGNGAGAHPSAEGHKAAATVLQDFLKTNVLSSDQLNAQTDAASLRAAIEEASATTNPSVVLQGAINRAQTELNVNTTDPYRLYQRLTAIETAKAATVKGVSLMPKEYISDTPFANDGVSYVWPSYMTSYGWVSLYKGGAGHYWPTINTPIDDVVDVDETPYVCLDFTATASFNATITYRRADGETAYVQLSELAGNGANDFTPCDRQKLMLDFGAYVRKQSHVGDNGLVSIVSCQMFVVGETDQVVQLFDCSFVNAANTDNAPTKLSGTYAVENGYLEKLTAGMTANELKAAMDHSDLLSVTDKDGKAVSGNLGTGMTLTLTVNGVVVDRATIVVRGDVNGDSTVSSVDARLMLKMLLNSATSAFDDAQTLAADMSGEGSLSTGDVRLILKATF